MVEISKYNLNHVRLQLFFCINILNCICKKSFGSTLRYIVVLMAQAKIYWNRENFQMVEKIFRKSVEFCNDDDTWKLNVAHVLFMQNKYKEAISFYEPIVKKHYDSVRLPEKWTGGGGGRCRATWGRGQ